MGDGLDPKSAAEDVGPRNQILPASKPIYCFTNTPRLGMRKAINFESAQSNPDRAKRKQLRMVAAWFLKCLIP